MPSRPNSADRAARRMQMSQVTELPPGCEEWEQWFREEFACRGRGVHDRIKQLRAALYRTKWLDEAARHHDPCVGDGYCNIDGPCKGCEAVNMAAEWRNWGER